MGNKSKIIGLGTVLVILNFYFRQRYLFSPLWASPVVPASASTTSAPTAGLAPASGVASGYAGQQTTTTNPNGTNSNSASPPVIY